MTCVLVLPKSKMAYFEKKCVAEVEQIVDLSKLSHKARRAFLKKQRRKLKRQADAKLRDEEIAKEEALHKDSPSYQARLQEQELEEQREILNIQDDCRRQHELWLWHEERFAERLKWKKEQEEKERLNKIEIERKIKEEWEERQRKEKEEEEERQKKKEKEEELLRQARQGENKDGEWHNPLAPVRYGQERQIQPCPFYAKVGACRFGDRCSRGHPLLESGPTLMFSSMFKHFQLDQGLCEEYDTDIVLEYEDSEVYQKFREFYDDTLPEFKAAGPVRQFKVCCNFQPHLRGNVYVTYTSEDDAMKAYAGFNARWYGGKQLTAQFVNIPSWRKAICGLFAKGRCPKGRECNFLHVFKNPSDEFSMADRDIEFFPSSRRIDDRNSSRRSRSRSRERRKRHSRSPSRRYRHSRSRSRGRNRNSRSRSRDRKRLSRDRSRDRSRYRRSRSRERKRHSRSKSRDRYRKRYSRSRSRSRSQESFRSSRSYSRKPKSKSSRDRKSRSHKHSSRSPERYSRSKSRDRESRSHKHDSRSISPDYDIGHKNYDNKDQSYISAKSKSSDKYKKKKKKRNKNDCQDDIPESIWVEKTFDQVINTLKDSATARSRSSSPSSDSSTD